MDYSFGNSANSSDRDKYLLGYKDRCTKATNRIGGGETEIGGNTKREIMGGDA